MGKQELQPITYELISEMRKKGLGYEVDKVLEEHRKDVKKAGVNASRDHMKMIYRVKKHLKICASFNCLNKPIKNQVYCKKCRKRIDVKYRK